MDRPNPLEQDRHAAGATGRRAGVDKFRGAHFASVIPKYFFRNSIFPSMAA